MMKFENLLRLVRVLNCVSWHVICVKRTRSFIDSVRRKKSKLFTYSSYVGLFSHLINIIILIQYNTD
ncbi:hypothetical protein HZ326_18592 [Fusarium oxysporum f. sp. albedinis]|nr:Uncharacterized protein HZ326_22132 [Fusarium oxysporum f. sp. albedinis]KAJ0138474.1 hypothetical protein HZ326_18592 [Fusarium oxysporum f. sp. albedinis]